MVGNDIVDLRGESERYHARFPQRVLSPPEAEAYARSDCSRIYLWKAWAAKEACYKMIRQSAPGCRFTPKAFVYDEAAESVHFSKWRIPVTFVVEREFVYCRAWQRGRNVVDVIDSVDEVRRWCTAGSYRGEWHQLRSSWPRESAAARILVMRHLQTRYCCSPGDIWVEVSFCGVPKAMVKGVPIGASLSISHHGRFVSVAFGFVRARPPKGVDDRAARRRWRPVDRGL